MDQNTTPINMDQISPIVSCPICMDDLNPNSSIQYPCGHVVCKNCWPQIIDARCSTFDVNNIVCYDQKCKQPITNIDTLIMKIEDKEIRNRYIYLKKKQEIIQDSNKFLCPNKECLNIINSETQSKIKHDYSIKMKSEDAEIQEINELDYSFLVCDKCNEVFCKVCEVYHQKGTANCLKRQKTDSKILLNVNIDFKIYQIE